VITGLVFWFSPHFNHGPVVAGRPPYILLFGLFSAYYSHEPVSGAGCLWFWLSNALLFGPLFFFFRGTPPPGVKGLGMGVRGGIYSLLFGASFFTMLYFYRLFPPHTLRWELYIAAASLLTIVSWFGAEAFARERLGSLRTSTQKTRAEASAGEIAQREVESFFRSIPGFRHASSNCAEGPGGLRLLFQTIFYPVFGLGFFMVVLTGLLLYLPMSAKGNHVFAGIFWAMCSMFLWFASFQVLPRALRQIRWLRTLPVSTTRLAGVFIFAPVAAMLAFMSLANLLLGLVYPIPQMSFLFMLQQGCFLQIALTTLLVPLILWRGNDALVCVMMLLMIMACAMGSIFIQKHFSLTAILAAAWLIILGSFLLTRLLLDRSSRVYRPRPGQTGGLFWPAEL